MSLKNIKAVIFDLDETLIDVTESLSIAQEAVAKELEIYLKEIGFKINLEKIQNKIKFVDDLMNMLLKYDRNDWWQFLVGQLGIDYNLNSEFKRKLTDVYWNFYIGSIKLYEDSIPTLEYLKGKGYSLGMITDTDGEPGKKKARIDNLNLCNLFDSIIIAGEDTKHTKPNPEPYLKIAKILKLDPDFCIFVGDKPFTDIKGALLAGMKTVLIQRRNWGIEPNITPDFIVKNLAQIKILL